MKVNIRLIFVSLLSLLTLSACVVHDTHRHHRGKRVVVKKPATINVVSLPTTARVVAHGGSRYTIHKGRFYRPHKKGFIVIKPPVGLTLTVLPEGFAKVKRDGVWFYHHDGVYLKWNAKRKVYIVVD